MTCSGLHCAGCAGGIAVPVVPLVAFLGVEWVIEHLVAVAAISGTCGVLSIAAVVFLMRWGERRDAAHRQLWTVRADALPPRQICHAVSDSAPPELGFRDLHIHLDGMPDTTQAAGRHPPGTFREDRSAMTAGRLTAGKSGRPAAGSGRQDQRRRLARQYCLAIQRASPAHAANAMPVASH